MHQRMWVTLERKDAPSWRDDKKKPLGAELHNRPQISNQEDPRKAKCYPEIEKQAEVSKDNMVVVLSKGNENITFFIERLLFVSKKHK